MGDTISISQIDIPENRSRDVDPDWVDVLAAMIAEAGLINPVTVRPAGNRYTLVTGLHRLSACTTLGWEAIPARISTAASDDEAKFEEIIENIGRNELNALDRAHHFYDLRHAYERLHPETKAGVAGALARHGSAMDNLSVWNFSKVAAEHTGLTERSIRRFVSIWKGLSVASRRRCTGTWIAAHQTTLHQLSKETPAQQANMLDLLLAEKPQVTNVADAATVLAAGRPQTYVERKFKAINNAIRNLKDGELEAVLAVHAKRFAAVIARMEGEENRRLAASLLSVGKPKGHATGFLLRPAIGLSPGTGDFSDAAWDTWPDWSEEPGDAEPAEPN